LFVAQAPIARSSPNYKRIQILDSRRDAAEFASKGYVTSGSEVGTKLCIFVADESTVPGDPWPALARGEMPIYDPHAQKPGVGVHGEELDDGTPGPAGRAPSLVVPDAWLDMRPRGLKLIQRNTLPLASVAEGPFGTRVLAARGDDAVHFVVLPPAA